MTNDPQRVNREDGKIIKKVTESTSSERNCDVDITVEIHAHKSDGFDEGTEHILSEKSKALSLGIMT